MEFHIIGIYSSSSSLASKFKERIRNCQKRLEEELGVKVVLGNLIFKNVNNYTTGTNIERANEFNALVQKCKILMPSIGGWNSNSILNLLDYNLIQERKIKIIGFSDTTAIILAIYKMTGMNVYYGQALLKDYDENNFVNKTNTLSIKDLILKHLHNYSYSNPKYYWDLQTDWNNQPINVNDMKLNNDVQYLNNASHTARLIGGNLNTIVSMLGTKYMPEINDGDILFFEESNKNIAEIERNLSALKNADIFKKIGGLIVGKFESYNDLESNIKYQDLILQYIEKKIPIIMNFDCGHTLPSLILEIGAIYKIDTKNKQLIKL